MNETLALLLDSPGDELNRQMAADLLDELGRENEATLLRSEYPVLFYEGIVRPVPRIRVSYSCVTPESASEGECSEYGWLDEEGHEFIPDEDETLVEMVVRFLKREGAYFDGSEWATTGYQINDYGTGEEQEINFHLEDFTDAEVEEIKRNLN